MNKLGIIAISILLVLSSMLWFLAGNSLNPYIEQYTAEFNLKYPNVKLSVGTVALDHSQGQGTTEIATVSLIPKNEQSQAISLSLQNILFFYDVKSFRKEAVIVNQLIVEDANLIVNKDKESSDIETLQQALTSILKEDQDKKSEHITGVLGRPEPLIHLQKVKFNALYITYYNKGVPEGEQIFRDIEITLPENSHAISNALIEAMINMLTQTNNALTKTM